MIRINAGVQNSYTDARAVERVRGRAPDGGGSLLAHGIRAARQRDVTERLRRPVGGDVSHLVEAAQFGDDARGQFNCVRVEVLEMRSDVHSVAIEQSVKLAARFV